MNESLYKTLVETASELVTDDYFDTINSDCIHDATLLFNRIKPTLDLTTTIEFGEVAVPVIYAPDFFTYHMDDVRHLRNLSRAYRFAAAVTAFNGDYKATTQYGVAILDLANAVRRGGLVVDHLVAIAISDCGIECLRAVRQHFAGDVRHDLIASLGRYESEREPFSEILKRDAKWEAESGYQDDRRELSEDEMIDPDSELSVEDQKAMIRLVNDFANRPELETRAMHSDLERRALAASRLLTVDLAIRCWKDRHGRYPESIAELAPDILFAVPRDPFTEGDFIYRASHDSFALYSTGPDRTDSGGKLGPWFAVAAGGYDLGLDAEDHRPECCTISNRPEPARRNWSWLSFWRRNAR